MELDLRVHGLTKRWFLNMYLSIVCVVALAVVLFCVFFEGYYTQSAKSLASEYSADFWVLSSAPADEFPALAKDYASSFENKDKIEVQIINSAGKTVASTTGFEPDGSSDRPDFEAAVISADGVGSFAGKNENGERIFAETYIFTNDDGTMTGAVRWLISAERIYRHIHIVQIFAVALGLVMLIFILISSLYFLSSIIKPLGEVSSAARKIAMGDFSTTLATTGKNEITELCDSINFMANELQQADKLKNDFISSVSHELRTPLTAIRGWGETAKMSIGVDNELVEQGLDVVLDETQRLSGLVEELLDFSRMQTGRLKMDAVPVKVSTALLPAVEMYRELSRQQNIGLEYLPMEHEPYVLGDINRIKQVFINIIDNAVKYTESGGQVLVQMQADEGCISVKVRDTGVGIPAADIDRVKEKFFKSNQTVRGSGIGLAMADEIMKQLGGLLFLESTEGVGTTVTVVFPVPEKINQPPSKEDSVSLDAAAKAAADAIIGGENTMENNEV